MATVYSLICFGGSAGKTVTMTIASPCVVSLALHGLHNGTALVFSTTGALPTGVTAGTTYYARWAATGTFHLYDTEAHAIDTGSTTGRVNTSGSQSGTHTVKWAGLAALLSTWGDRWGSAGARVYDGIKSARDARYSAASALDTEYIELAHDYDDILSTAAVVMNIPAAETIVTTKIDGVRTSAYHEGQPGAGCTGTGTGIPDSGTFTGGYCIVQSTYFVNGIEFTTGDNTTFEGLCAAVALQNVSVFRWNTPGLNNKTINCIAIAYGASANVRVGFDGTGADIFTWERCIAIGFVGTSSIGFKCYGYSNKGSKVVNNISSKNNVGFSVDNVSDNKQGMVCQNNISVGNTTNWSTYNSTYFKATGYNAGLSTDSPWYKTTDTSVDIATTDFLDYTNNDFRAATTSSPQVDTGTTVLGGASTDIADAEVPAYNNGSAETWDVGAFEKNLGYTRPEVHTIDFTGLVAGSQVVVFTTGTTTELFRDNSSSTSESYDAAAAGVTVDYTVMKAGYLPLRATGIALTATATPIVIAQVADRAYVASSGLTFTTNATANTSTKIFSINAASTGQNWYSFMIEAWIAQASLANVAFPLTVNGPNSVTLGGGWEWRGWASSQTQGTGISNTSLALLSRDGMRYVAANGTVNAIWSAILTLDTTAGLQVEYRQATAGTITSAANTGPMDQLVQVYGSASYGNFDYRGHMVLKVRKVGYTSPKPDLVATYGNLEDQLYVAGLDPELLYTTTNADPGSMAFDNTAKTAIISASRSILQLYQGAQWWSIQDAQWDADIPVTANTAGSTFTLATGWTLSGMNYITGTQTIAGGTITLAGPATYTPTFSANTAVTAQGEGTYVLNASSTNITFAPTANGVTYVMGDCVFSGTINFHNTHATRAITIEVPSGTSYTTSTAGGTVTVTAPQVYQSVTVTGAVSGSRIQIYDTTSSTELYNGTPTFPYTWTDGTPAAATRAIRLRVAKMSTVTAKEFIDVNIGTCATSGSGKDVSYLVSQSDDATYNSNAIDGSGVTGITIGVGPNRVSISIAGGSVTWPSIYAYQVYWQATATGIAQETAFIEAPDTANYLLTDFDIRNTHANPLTITGGWGRDSTTLTVAGCIDSAGSTGNIYPEPDHVVAFATGSALTAGQAAELTASAAAAAAAASAAADAETAANTAASSAATASTQATLARKYLSNKRIIDEDTGIETVYDDNGTAMEARPVYVDKNAAVPYDGTAAPHRVEKFT